MLKLFYIAISTFLCQFSIAQGIKFHYTQLDSAQVEAKKTGKNIFIDAYTTWCGPCKHLSKNIFTLPTVGEAFNKDFINVKLNMETPQGQYLLDYQDINAYRTLLVIDGDGKLIKKIVGAPDEKTLIKWANLALHPENSEYLKTLKTFQNPPNSLDFLMTHLKNCENEFEDTDAVIRAIQTNLSEKDLDSSNYFNFIEQNGLPFENKLAKYYIENFNNFELKYKEKALNPLILILKDGFINAYETDNQILLEEVKISMRKSLVNHPDIIDAFEQAIRETEGGQ